MRKTAALSVVALALLAGCAARDEPAATSATGPTEGVLLRDSPEDAPRPTEFTTAILEDGTFQHPRLELGRQTTLIWWNVDDLTHSVVSDDGQFAGSGPIPPGGEFMRTFQTAGTYAYHCRYHPEMQGTIVIE